MGVAAKGTDVRALRVGAQRWSRLMACVAALAWMLAHIEPARAAEAQAAQGPPLNIALFVSSRGDLCYDTGEVAAIKRLTFEEQERINRRGGVAGRPLNVRIFDDERDEGRSIANMRAALADRSLLGMVGLSNSGRAKAVFSALGDDIRKNGSPFLSEISVSDIFAGHSNVFTTRSSQDEERVPVMAAFTRALGFSKPAFLGSADSVMSDAMRDSLRGLLGENGLAADQRIRVVDGKPDAAGLAAAVAELASRAPDIIYMSVGSRAAPEVIAALTAARVTPPLFVAGRIDALPAKLTSSYPSALYQLAWENLPEVYNSRLRTLVVQAPSNPWFFEGAKNARAPGWTSGECKPREEIRGARDPFDASNMRAIAVGARYADMVALIAGSLRAAPRGTPIEVLRSTAVAETTTGYAAGRGAFKGTFENWSFDPGTRTASRTPFVVILPRGLGRLQLAPVQFRRARDGSLRQIKTLYMDIDLIKAHRVDDNEKTFFAEFYLAMHDDPAAEIDNIEFANAYLDPRTHGRQISIEALHTGGGGSGVFPSSMKVYKVVGRFLFDPRLASYPFDTQSFSIEVLPKRGDAAFIVQPPPHHLRDKTVSTEGWEPVTHYVGYDEDFVPVVDSFTHQASVAPFYKASFVWTMRRETTDYFLRVVVPLVFILGIAYLSIFIPGAHFEAIVTIQVTALLSAVALYISLPKLDSDAATLSDRIFVFNYMLVSIMIAISILRINPLIAGHRWMRGALEFVHVAIIPALVAVAAYFVYGKSVAS
jgi:hypothetical protein